MKPMFEKNTSIEGFSLASNYFRFKMYKRIIAAKGYQQLSLTTISFCLKWLHTRQMYSSGGGRLFLLQGDGFYFKWCRITVCNTLWRKNWNLTYNTITTLKYVVALIARTISLNYFYIPINSKQLFCKSVNLKTCN